MKKRSIIGIVISIVFLMGLVAFVISTFILAKQIHANVVSMIAGTISAIAAAGLGIVALIQNSIYKNTNDEAQDRLEKINKEILDRSAMPYFSLRNIQWIKRAPFWDRFVKTNIVQEKKEREEYCEYENREYYFEIDGESKEIIAKSKENERITNLKNKIYDYAEGGNNVSLIVDTTDFYIPTKLKNIGQGAAVSIWLVFYKKFDDSSLPSEGLRKLAFNTNDEMQLNFYIADRKKCSGKYELYIQYKDIYANRYEQRYYIEIKDGVVSSDFSGKQTKLNKEKLNDSE